MFKTSQPRHLQPSQQRLKRRLTILVIICLITSTIVNCYKLYSYNNSSDEPKEETASAVSNSPALSFDEESLNDFFSEHSATRLMSTTNLHFTSLDKIAVNAEESVEEETPEEDISDEPLFSSSQYGADIPRTVYLHLSESTGNLSDFSWVPEVSFEKLSDEDVSVDLGSYQSKPLEVSDTIRKYLYLITTREARGESFLGQLAVAEDICNRIRSGTYGSDIIAILCNGYEAEKDSAGILHFYDGNGQELLKLTESCKEAVDIALSGSNITSVLLEAVTNLQNERYGLELGSEYYQNGATFHFAPKYISDKSIQTRCFQRVPVAFAIENHIFYGYWHTSDNPLEITIEY